MQGNKYHYIVSRQLDGTVAIQDGSKFDSPVELVQYHMRHVDGLLTTLKVPCRRSQGTPPQGYRFITHDEMQTAMRQAALQLGYQVRPATSVLKYLEGGDGGLAKGKTFFVRYKEILFYLCILFFCFRELVMGTSPSSSFHGYLHPPEKQGL